VAIPAREVPDLVWRLNVFAKDVEISFKKTTKQPNVFGMKFSLREIERTFPIEIRNFKL